MLLNLVIIIVTDIAFEFLFEKLNQSKLEPFEKIQAKTRFLPKKKIWQYSVLVGVLLAVGMLGVMLNFGASALTALLGIILALVNTIFESTFFDQMRNTLR